MSEAQPFKGSKSDRGVQTPPPDLAFEAEVRLGEPDLWLSSRLVSDPVSRTTLTALYAVHVELARVARAATSPLAGEIRLAWWREECEAVLAGRGRPAHPALRVLGSSPRLFESLLAMIEARHAELEDRPFGDETALLAYVDGAEGGLMRAAGDVLGGFGDLDPVAAARSWGLTRLLRDGPAWAARGRTWTPETWSKAPEGAARGRLARWALDERALLRVRIRALPVHAFPALAHFALIGPYCAGRSPAGIEKRLRVVGAAVIGRI